jgi:hypothetical protein
MKLKPPLVATIVCCLFPGWVGHPGIVYPSRALADDAPAATRDSSWVDGRVEAWQPTRAERAFDEIGWASSLAEAHRLAQAHGRPMFLFTYDGEDLACFRC